MPLKFQYKDLKNRSEAIELKIAHTFKMQAIIHSKTQQILSLCMSKGVVDGVELFKRNLDLAPSNSFILADKALQKF